MCKFFIATFLGPIVRALQDGDVENDERRHDKSKQLTKLLHRMIKLLHKMTKLL